MMRSWSGSTGRFHRVRDALMILVAFFFLQMVQAEGVRALRPNYAPENQAAAYLTTRSSRMASFEADSLNRLYISIADTSETIFFGFGHASSGSFLLNSYLPGNSSWCDSVGYRLMDPDGQVVLEGLVPLDGQGFIGDSSLEAYQRGVIGPQQLVGDSGYLALSYKPDKTGDYYLAVKNLRKSSGKMLFQLFDVTVGSADIEVLTGRLWAYKWRLFSYGESQDFQTMHPFEGKIYAYSGDQVVTEIEFRDFRPFEFTIYCNASGVYSNGDVVQNRQSIRGSGTAPPEYPLFLNPPDSTLFPTGELSCVKALSTVYQCNRDDYVITLETSKKGHANVFLDIDRDGEYNADGRDIMFDAVAVQADQVNEIAWDGRDGLGNRVPYNDSVPVIAYMIAGITHLPAIDVERCGGLNIKLIRPHTDCLGNSLDSVRMYWDDSKVGGTTELNGCLDFCRSWEMNEKTNNTWWYIINEKTQGFFVARDTALLVQMDTSFNSFGYYHDGDTVVIDAFYRNDQFSAAKLLDSLVISTEYPDRYELYLAGFDSSLINSYTGHLRSYWVVRNFTSNTIYDLFFQLTFKTQYCDEFRQIRQLGDVQAEVRTESPTCSGWQDAALYIENVRGGTGRYLYSIEGGSNWQASGTFENIKAGTYHVVVQNMFFPALRWEMDSVVIEEPEKVDVALRINGQVAESVTEICETDSRPVAHAVLSEEVSRYNWTKPNGDQVDDSATIRLSEQGTYRLHAYDDNNCVDSTQTSFLVYPTPEVIWIEQPQDTVYAGQTMRYVLQEQQHVQYEWRISDYGNIIGVPFGNEVEIVWQDTAFVFVEIVLASENILSLCQALDTLSVFLVPAPSVRVDFARVDQVESCSGEKDGQATVGVSGGKDELTLKIQKDGGDWFDTLLFRTPVVLQLDKLESARYQVFVSSMGNTSSAAFTVPVASSSYNLIEHEKLICPGDTARWEVYAEYESGVYWMNQQGDTLSATPKLNSTIPGMYEVHIVWTSNCRARETAFVSEPDWLAVEGYVRDFAFCPDICDGVIGIRTLEGVMEKWQSKVLPNGISQELNPGKLNYDCCSGTYELMGINASGCIARDTVSVSVQHDDCLHLPNAFSPNADGYNDTWELPMLHRLYPHAIVSIFDRRGVEVFLSQEGYPKPWDGRYNGLPLPWGSYHYVIVDAKTSSLITTGQVSIFR